MNILEIGTEQVYRIISDKNARNLDKAGRINSDEQIRCLNDDNLALL